MYNGGHIQKCKEQLELAYKWPIFCSIATYWGHRKVRRDVWGHNVAFCTVAIQRVSKRHLENYYVWIEIYVTMIKSELRNGVVRLASHPYFQTQRTMSNFFDTFLVTNTGGSVLTILSYSWTEIFVHIHHFYCIFG